MYFNDFLQLMQHVGSINICIHLKCVHKIEPSLSVVISLQTLGLTLQDISIRMLNFPWKELICTYICIL